MTVGDLQDKIAGLDRSVQVLIPSGFGDYFEASKADVADVWNDGEEYFKTQCADDAKPALLIE